MSRSIIVLTFSGFSQNSFLKKRQRSPKIPRPFSEIFLILDRRQSKRRFPTDFSKSFLVCDFTMDLQSWTKYLQTFSRFSTISLHHK